MYGGTTRKGYYALVGGRDSTQQPRRYQMTQLALVVDDELCLDCKACEVARKQENDVPIGLRWITVLPPVGPKKVVRT